MPSVRGGFAVAGVGTTASIFRMMLERESVDRGVSDANGSPAVVLIVRVKSAVINDRFHLPLTREFALWAFLDGSGD